MAQQLLENRTAAAYAGVEKYARTHANEDAGALGWLVIGYAHILDNQFALAIPPLKKAKPRAGELADYVDFFLASAEGASGNARDAVATLKDFDKRYPESLFLRDAAVIAANNLVTLGQTKAAIDLLKAHEDPTRADVELALGRAEAKAGNIAEAVTILRRVHFRMPLAPEADAAQVELDSIGNGSGLGAPAFADRRYRATALLERRPADAVPELKGLLNDAPADQKPELTLDLAQAESRSGREHDAKDLLNKMADPGGELGARRRYYLLELARPDVDQVAALIDQMRSTASASEWFELALLSAGNMYVLRDDNGTAARFYEELVARFPNGKNAAYANWRAGWLEYRNGQMEQAQVAFERQVKSYPESDEASAAMYWMGRLSEQQNNVARAKAFYTKTVWHFRNDYYSDLARERLRDLNPKVEMDDDPLLASLPPVKAPPKFAIAAPEDDPRVEKSLLLENCGMVDFAVRELKAAGESAGEDWSTASIVRLLTDTGAYQKAIEYLKHEAPGYYSFTDRELPRPLWEGLFPKPYWKQLKQYSTSNQVDPFLVASLIRQESEFNPGAISHARAVGLMQLLPKTGRKIAKEEKLRHYNEGMLFDPSTNLELGTRYLRHLLDKYNGQVEYALAAYNAGPERVDSWKNGHYNDIHEFVESIPFTETRQYVEAVVRNQGMYQQLYGTP